MESIPSSDDEKEHADPGWLIQDKPEDAQPPVAPGEGPVAAGEGYEVIDAGPVEGEEEPPSPVVPPIPEAPPRPARPKAAEDDSRASSEPAVVDVVWSRWGEWGPDLMRLGGVVLATGFLLYLTLAAAHYQLAFLVFLLGLAAVTLLSYPLAITLERPVRVTPEQAVKDFYGALSHSVPHYRRMWLLLSSAGRKSPQFASFEGFRAYWKERIAALDGDTQARFNPLLFEVEDFRSEKSRGLTALDGTFTLKVRHRRLADRAVRTFHIEMGLVKGPDRMWYLNKGTVPKV